MLWETGALHLHCVINPGLILQIMLLFIPVPVCHLYGFPAPTPSDPQPLLQRGVPGPSLPLYYAPGFPCHFQTQLRSPQLQCAYGLYGYLKYPQWLSKLSRSLQEDAAACLLHPPRKLLNSEDAKLLET